MTSGEINGLRSQDTVTVVIRSVGERTESLCRQLVLGQGVPEPAVFVVRETPFVQAMRVAFDIGLSQGRPWTLCVDADVLLGCGAISRLLAYGEAEGRDTCEVQGLVLDKFFGGPRPAGNHLYRTRHLPRVIETLPEVSTTLRPEHNVLQQMKRKGYPWKQLPTLLGLHDFEQAYTDIYRKAFLQARKHLYHADVFLPFWAVNSQLDEDFRVALDGFAAGLTYRGPVRVDADGEYFQSPMERGENVTKGTLSLNEWDPARVDEICQGWIEPKSYVIKFSDRMGLGGRVAREGIVRQCVSLYKRRSPEFGMIRTLIYLCGVSLVRLGSLVKSSVRDT